MGRIEGRAVSLNAASFSAGQVSVLATTTLAPLSGRRSMDVPEHQLSEGSQCPVCECELGGSRNFLLEEAAKRSLCVLTSTNPF